MRNAALMGVLTGSIALALAAGAALCMLVGQVPALCGGTLEAAAQDGQPMNCSNDRCPLRGQGQRHECPSLCTEFGACSLTRILATASGEDLKVFFRERQEDGRSFSNFPIPSFEARTLSGERVRSADLTGTPAVVAFLALHCNHSIESLPILKALQERLGDSARVVAVLVNSGPPEDVAFRLPSHFPAFDNSFEVWVYEHPSLGDLIGSHLVPTYFFADESGMVKKKLVTFKEKRVVAAEAARLLAGASVEE